MYMYFNFPTQLWLNNKKEYIPVYSWDISQISFDALFGSIS